MDEESGIVELLHSKRRQTGRDKLVNGIPTPREERRKLLKECDELWGKIIRARDKTCQWCGSKKDGHGHHIIAKPRLKRMKCQTGRHDTRNGVRLCKACHLYKLKDYPDEYNVWLENWLNKKGLSIDKLLEIYGVPAREELSLVKLSLEAEWKQARS